MAPIPTFVDYVIAHGKTRGHQPAILLADRVITYAMLAEATLTAEAKIADLKLLPGSIIGICVSSPIRHFALLSAIIRGGHTGISVYKVGDIAALGVSAACVLTEKLDFLPAFRQVVADDGWFASTNRLAAATSRPRDENDVLRIEFSSGTTGRPKALDMTAHLMASRNSERLYLHSLFPWSRASSLMDVQSGWGLRNVAAVLSAGRSVLLHTSHVDALKIGVVYHVDCLMGSVGQLTGLVEIQKADPVPNLGLKAVITAGSVIGQRQIEDICMFLSPNVISFYVSTEAGLIAFAEGHELLRNPRSAGPLVPWVDVRIEDEAGALQPLGVSGVLKVRPFYGFAKPHGGKSPDLESAENDWFTPGDLAILHEGDMLEIVGRIDELINIGGVKRAPEIIDAAIKRHPAILDCAAFLLPMKDGGVCLAAAIMTAQPVDLIDLLNWCAAQEIGVRQLFNVSELPRTTTGKIKRHELAQRFSEAQ